MKTVLVNLNEMAKVQPFVNILAKFDCDFDLVSGRYIVDAKSILGVYSLNLSKPIELVIHETDNIDAIMEALAPYLA